MVFGVLDRNADGTIYLHARGCAHTVADSKTMRASTEKRGSRDPILYEHCSKLADKKIKSFPAPDVRWKVLRLTYDVSVMHQANLLAESCCGDVALGGRVKAAFC
jgi:hypothetical protein